MEPHEVRHRRGHEFAATWHVHIDIGVGDNRSAVGIDNLAVNARVMVPLFFNYFK